ncbi:GNAT family N-acetyltransferase [Glaciimonas soli]|uniref:GNAT family N-acetyltransferase n=1 Tax=Glaciimonas soli TaxID=2590999 RepID=A0A843YRI7_9BURK|nr:GNAT family N-acetyltransferase [Glaciimonas soli]MQR00607.1 GNAT family N-acetyltransferase [Glaciimonas soli]
MHALGIASELMFHRISGNVRRDGSYTVIETKNNPDSYSGNTLLLARSPTYKNRATLETDFASLIGKPPTIRHRSFMWPLDDAEVFDPSAFVQDGYEYCENIVLVATKDNLRAPLRLNHEIEIRSFSSDQDWQDLESMQIRENDNVYPEAEFRNYLAGQRRTYQTLIDADRGNWWGAYKDGKQVASLGLFFDENIGRFQSVLTDAVYRNQGIARTLVHHVAQLGFAEVERLVMVADRSHHALRMYEELGFKAAERFGTMLWVLK